MSGPALIPITQALALLRFPEETMSSHTSRQSAGSLLLLVVDPGKP